MINFIFFKVIGAIGLLLICTGMIVRKRFIRDDYSILGGICLLIYSVYLKDIIFIILQAIYIIVVSFDFYKERKKLKK